MKYSEYFELLKKVRKDILANSQDEITLEKEILEPVYQFGECLRRTGDAVSVSLLSGSLNVGGFRNLMVEIEVKPSKPIYIECKIAGENSHLRAVLLSERREPNYIYPRYIEYEIELSDDESTETFMGKHEGFDYDEIFKAIVKRVGLHSTEFS